MNHTIEDSKLQVMAGTTTIFGKDGRVEAPKNENLRTDEIVDTSFIGMEISVKTNNEKQEKFMESLPNYKEYRDSRMTKTAYERRLRESNIGSR